MTNLRIQVLGPSAVWRGEHRLDLGPAGQRAVFGLLVLAHGRALGRNEITAGLWPERSAPPAAANVIQTYVKHLRRLLEPDRAPRAASAVLRSVADGYVLHVPGATVDVARFRQHVADAVGAQQRGHVDQAAESLAVALALWHGPPLADIPALATHPKVVALTCEWQEALARYGEVMIATGRAADGLPALEEAVSGQPLNEAWQARLIRAYQAAGRRGDAFATYHEVRRHLADDLGVDPGSELAAAHAALLHSDAPPDAASPVLAQLPADSHTFAGRAAELSHLDGLIPGSYAHAAVAVVSGTPGVGKTVLVVHWAHRNAQRFPDGQLYLNLRGFEPDGIVLESGEALRSMLESLGVPAERMPTTMDGRAALFRSLLAGRRMLIVLDNARDVAQVRPLLPGAPGCLVLVTARHQLTGLVAAEGAHPLRLEPLARDEARQLLAQRVGAARIAAEPDAAAEILDRCAGLPLALVILAARMALTGSQPLAVLAEQVRRRRDRLDALSTGDPGTDLRAVFSWSYDALGPDVARLFRLLGLAPGPDISVSAAAGLAAVTVGEARRLLTELVRAGLAAESRPGRYSQHDLVRTYAAEVASSADSARVRRSAVLRILDHYLHSACAADRAAHPARTALIPEPYAAGVVPDVFAGTKQALAWFAAERAVLVAAVDRAASVSMRHAWQLARSLSTYLDLRGHWDDLAVTQRIAVVAAGESGHTSSQADAHRRLARAYTRLHRVDDAHLELLRGLDLYCVAGDRSGQGHIHLNLALMCERQGRYAESLDHSRRGLETFLSIGDVHGIARARNSVGWYHALLGDPHAALEQCGQALDCLTEFGDRAGQAATWDTIGYARHLLGQYGPAAAAYQLAIHFYRAIGDRHLEAFVRSHLGDTHHADGNYEAARSVWRQALDTLERCDPPEAAKLRARLTGNPAARPRTEPALREFNRDPAAVQSLM